MKKPYTRNVGHHKPMEHIGGIAAALIKDMSGDEYNIDRRTVLNLMRILWDVVEDRYKLKKLEGIARDLAKRKVSFFVKRQFVKCNTKCKKCPHGPYYYVYYREDGVQKSRYLGKPLK